MTSSRITGVARRFRRFEVAKVAVISLTLAISTVAFGGCSDNGEPPASVNALEADLQKAARRNAEAYLSGDDTDSYESLSADCQALWSHEAWKTNLSASLQVLEVATNADPSTMRVETVLVRDVATDRGEANVVIVKADGTPALPDTSQFATWQFEDGAWRSTSCDSVVREADA